MNPLLLSHFTATSCAGRGLDATLAALRDGRGGLAPCSFEGAPLATYAGRVAGIEETPVHAPFAEFDCRNNRLAQMAMEEDGFADRVKTAIATYGEDRVGMFMGTSTAGILETERAYRRRDPASGALPADFNYATTHNPYFLASFVRAYFGLSGPAVSVSSACSSGAKVFGAVHARNRPDRCSRRRWRRHVVPDDALRLQLARTAVARTVQAVRCEARWHFDRRSSGVRARRMRCRRRCHRTAHDAIRLLDIGESSDAYHSRRRIPKDWARGSRWNRRLPVPRSGCARYRLRQSSRHGHAQQ